MSVICLRDGRVVSQKVYAIGSALLRAREKKLQIKPSKGFHQLKVTKFSSNKRKDNHRNSM